MEPTCYDIIDSDEFNRNVSRAYLVNAGQPVRQMMKSLFVSNIIHENYSLRNKEMKSELFRTGAFT